MAVHFSDNALQVLEKRYLAKDSEGKITETPEEMLRRVAKAVAAADEKYDKKADLAALEEDFFALMSNLYFLPNSPTLMNAGRRLGQLSACFVLPVEDSMEAIFEAVKNAALIHKSGGGTGFSFTRLRSNGSPVDSTGGIASGPVSFMRVFNTATEAVKQGGTRRGANMGILNIDHPDILEFIDSKKDSEEITNFNISVGITEEFMEKVASGEDYNLIDPHTKIITDTLNAKEVFDHIVDAAWRNGEPGIVFLDRLNNDNPVPELGAIEATNPCGEQPLLPYESCNLGSINLSKMVKETDKGTAIDWQRLGDTVEQAVHFLDNVIEINNYPLDAIRDATLETRKIGLGVMGFADLLLLLGVPYNSPQALDVAERVMGFVTDQGRQASARLAKERGAFPQFEKSTYADGEPLRNATITTIAPTGTLSLLAGCSSGIEPVFAYAYFRLIMNKTKMLEGNPILEKTLQQRGLYSEELMHTISEEGTLAAIEEIPQDIRNVFVCAHDVGPLDHINMQAAFQRHTDNAVSKTVNFPNSATRDDVALVYKLAYEEDCKGVTIYRDGSRDSQVLNVGKDAKDKVGDGAPQQAYGEITPRPRPAITYGFTERMKIGCGNLYVTVNYDDNGICEVFTSTGKAGGCASQSEATARLCSVALRSGMSVHEVYDQLKGIRCPSTIRQGGMSCTSCPDGIAKVVMKVHKYIEARKDDPELRLEPEPLTRQTRKSGNPGNPGNPDDPSGTLKSGGVALVDAKGKCPDCGFAVEHEGGCVVCRSCGYSKCG